MDRGRKFRGGKRRGGHRGGGPPGKRRRMDGGHSDRRRPTAMDSIDESAVGIEHFVTKSPGFGGILKHRFADFHVREIAVDGTVLHLDDVPDPHELKDESKMTPSKAREFSWEDYCAWSSREEGEAALRRAMDDTCLEVLLAYVRLNPEARPPRVVLPRPMNTKDDRRQAHHTIRSYFPFVQSDVVEMTMADVVAETRGWSRLESFAAAGGDGSASPQSFLVLTPMSTTERRRRDHWPDDRPPYLNFVLHKTNVDTMTAVQDMARLLRRAPRTFSFAGSKDKRGITVQQCSVYHLEAVEAARINRTLKGLRVGNFAFVPREKRVALGSLRGNQFTVVIRDVDASPNDDGIPACRAVLEEWDRNDHAYINYFGLQRFGAFTVPTHHIGRALLRGEYATAVSMILRFADRRLLGGGPSDPLPSESALRVKLAELLIPARNVLRTSDNLRGAIAETPFADVSGPERDLLQGLLRRPPGDLVGALCAIPRSTRTLYVHAYQSYLWNKVLSWRLRRFGDLTVRAGDLILRPATSAAEAGQEDAEWTEGGGEDVDTVAAALASPHDEPEEVEEEEGASGRSGEVEATAEASHSATDRGDRVHRVTQDEASAGMFSIGDLVMPMLGSRSVFPGADVGGLELARLLAEDGLMDARLQEHLVKEGVETIPEPIVPQRLARVPSRSAEGAVPVAAPSPSAKGIASASAPASDPPVMESGAVERDMFGADAAPRKLGMGDVTGDYRKVLRYADNVSWDIVSYTDPNASLVDADIDRLRDAGKFVGNPASAGGSRPPTRHPAKPPVDAAPARTAVKLSFTLPSSGYATMVMRELMKVSTNARGHAAWSAKQNSDRR